MRNIAIAWIALMMVAWGMYRIGFERGQRGRDRWYAAHPPQLTFERREAANADIQCSIADTEYGEGIAVIVPKWASIKSHEEAICPEGDICEWKVWDSTTKMLVSPGVPDAKR